MDGHQLNAILLALVIQARQALIVIYRDVAACQLFIEGQQHALVGVGRDMVVCIMATSGPIPPAMGEQSVVIVIPSYALTSTRISGCVSLKFCTIADMNSPSPPL